MTVKENMKMSRKNVLASMLIAGLGVAVISAAGCGGTQYGGKPSSIPRDVDSDDAASSGTGAQPQSTPPSNTGSPGTGTGSTGGTGTRR
jgi:hypothetical protein